MSNTEFPYRYICIEGNIGSGKSSFCQMMGERYNCKVIMEEFDENPFLPFFYENQEKYAFAVELFFMTERHKQLEKSLIKQDLFHDFFISDYTFVKNLLFAGKNLAEREFRIYQKIFQVLNNDVPKPDIIVYFHRDVKILKQQISKRGRSYESNIKEEYLLTIQHAYFEYFRNILTFPVLIIDLNTIDFVKNPQQFEEVKNLISKKYLPGVHRYSLLV